MTQVIVVLILWYNYSVEIVNGKWQIVLPTCQINEFSCYSYVHWNVYNGLRTEIFDMEEYIQNN